ncbi:MAG: beta-N-acetylhexosaminidase [Bacteroidaceae bacterium]|nr:beta-N-acetylhexosaminidase [Bacteroidaceae bacterium]
MKRVFLFVVYMCSVNAMLLAQNISLIPQPAEMSVGEGVFEFEEKTRVKIADYQGDSIEWVFEQFAVDFKQATGISFKRTKKSSRADIELFTDKSLGCEAYTLDVTKEKISIGASEPSGFFYALQTLKQLMPRNVMAAVADNSVKVWSVPVVSINDAPRFHWRGFMLDEGRHFYGKEEIKKILDIMSAYKMNRFHWHLTEDQGWRIEIKKYPKLTETGAWRNSRVLGWGDVKPDGIHYGGFYTQEDAKEIVAYAKERFIEIVPEVDIPGHSQAAVASYPEFLACDPENNHEVWLWQGVSSDVINVSNARAVQFAKDVIDELTSIFPYKYIHLGGDECPTAKWERNEDCKKLLAEIGSTNYRDLQINFYRQLKEHIAAKPLEQQRNLIFWNEVLHGNTEPLGNDITIMAWIGANEAAKDAAMRGMNTILSPQIPYYINRKQSKNATEPHSQGHGTETVEAVYNYVPMNNVPSELHSKYLGVQANFWTEWVETADIVQYLTLPRLAAVAEAGWTPQTKRNYNDFKQRMQGERVYYNLKGVNFGKHIFK